MQNRLQLCSEYLKEVEGKLIQLRNASGDDEEATSTLVEALGFIEQAESAVSQGQQRVRSLHRARTDSGKRASA